MNVRSRAISITVVIFALLTYLFAWSPVFSVRSITVVGAPAEVTSQSIIMRSKIFKGEKLSRIDPRAIEKHITELSWVKSASVNRNWVSGSVQIQLISRVPVGIYKGKVIDSDGELFELAGKTPKGLPVVSASSPELGLEAIALFTHLPLTLRDSLVTVSATNSTSISSWHRNGSNPLKITWGDSREIDLKVSVLQALLALPENKNVRRVDLSAPHAPIVK